MSYITDEEMEEFKKIYDDDLTVKVLSSVSWKVGNQVVTRKQFGGGYKCNCLDSRKLGGNPNCKHIEAVKNAMRFVGLVTYPKMIQ